MNSPPVHLDTSFLVRALQRDSPQSERLLEWLQSGRPIAISALAWSEFLCGPVSADQREAAIRVLDEPVPLLGRHGELAAQLFSTTGRRRGSLADCLIAAVAMDANAALATADEEFARLAAVGLQLA